MCNLYGYYKRDKNLKCNNAELIPDTELLKLRGRDSFGYVYVTEYGKTFKTVLNKVDLEAAKDSGFDYFAFESRAIPEPELIEHAREGLNHDRDTQPFVSENWVTSHNGTIVQPEKVIKDWDLYNLCSPVDSALLPQLFEVCNPVRALKYHLHGSFALVAYDKLNHSLYLMATFQPLYYTEKNNYIYYASVEKQLEYLLTPIIKIKPYSAIIFEQGIKREESLYKHEENNKVLVICSGGLDSVTTARLYQVLGYEVSCLHIKYDQAAETIEDQMVKKICDYYGYPLMVLNLRDVFNQCAKSSTLITKMRQTDIVKDAEGTPSYVGNRNMIFASIAAGIAEENNIGRVVMGLNLSDGSAYPDNCLPYLLNMEETLKTSLNQQSRVLFRSPFVNLMKHEVLQIAFAIGSPLPWQVSCYFPELDENGNPMYCSGCGSHLLRGYAFKYLKVKDPVKYKDGSFNFDGCKDLNAEFYIRMNNKELKLKYEEIPFWQQIKEMF